MPKTILITGASGNLGSVVTKYFLNKGYTVIATTSSEEGKKDFPASASLQPEAVDLANEKETGSFIQRMIEKNRQIDCALLLAGGFAMGNIANTSSENIRQQISLNFETAYHIVRPIYQHMIEKDFGRIILIGSRPALKSSDGKKMVAYALSKSLLFHLADFINDEAKTKNVTATVIVPSTIDTPANRKSMPDAHHENWVRPESLAAIMEFVVSDDAAALRETVLKVYNNA